MAAAKVQDLKSLPTVLTTRQVKEFLGLSMPKTLQVISSEGFPVLKLGKAFRIPKDQFLAWVHKQSRGTRRKS